MKYKNRKIEVDGINFDSVKEAKRYQDLKFLQKCGKISDLEFQKEYELIPAQYELVTAREYEKSEGKKKGKCIERACKYYADFVYKMDGQTIVEDVKGYRDPASAAYAKFTIKRKLMLYKYGIRIKEV